MFILSIIIIIIFLFVVYSILILYYWQSWNAIPVFKGDILTAPIPVSVIVAARNEEKNITVLLQSLQAQTYPASWVEIIVVDDQSTDRTAELVSAFPGVRLLRLEQDGINSYKKKAIDTGIAAATGELIVTTDADCIVPPSWLQTITSYKAATRAGFIVAPVVFDTGAGSLQIFQAMDFMILQGITGASVYKNIHSMCNGANLAYEKKLFYAVNGFSGIDHIASGDDMLLMHKITEKFPGSTQYLKSAAAVVSTQPMSSWREFFNQRIRWASKATHYNDKRIFLVLLLVYLFNLSFLVMLVAGFWWPVYWVMFGLLWIAKTIVEFPFLYAVAVFFNRRYLLKYFFFFQPVHIGYTIISGLLGQLGSYEWKGRKVN